MGGFSRGPAIRIVHSMRLLEKDVERVFRRGGNSSRRKRAAEIGREAAAEIAEEKNPRFIFRKSIKRSELGRSLLFVRKKSGFIDY